MWSRRVVLAAMILAIAGCGGPAGVAMGNDGLQIAKRLQDDVKKKQTQQLDLILKRAQQMRDNKTVRSDEFAAIQKICNYMKAGEWEKAQELVDSCVDMSQRGS